MEEKPELEDLTLTTTSLNTDMNPNYKSIEYVMELHKEIERLKTEKLILLRNNLENQEKIESLTKKQETLEKGILDANREMKLLKIGKKPIF